MKIIDINNWERKEHYNYFKSLDYPHFNICANIDITEFYKFVKKERLPFFLSFLYNVMKTANSIKEFRYRIRNNEVIEHELVHPAFTIMTTKGVFSFCSTRYNNNFEEFILDSRNEIEKSKKIINIGNEPESDNLIYTTSIPWVSFTGITHPISKNPVDSIPRIAWGKYFEEFGKVKLPLSVQVHHALADGSHVGQYFRLIEEILQSPIKNL